MTADATVATPNLAGDCSSWKRLRIASWNWLIRPDVCVELESRLPLVLRNDDPAAEATVIKQGPHRTVCRFGSAAGEFYLKQFHQPDLRTRLRHWLRRSQAHWELSRHQRAQQRGIPTTDVVAIGHAAAWGGESCLVTQGIPGVTPLNEWLCERTATLELAHRRTLAEQLGRLVAKMHRRGVIHHDLHAGNVLLRQEPGGWRLWVVDLSALRFQSTPASWPDIGHHLGRLRHSLLPYLCETDQTAFFQSYWQAFQQNSAQTADRRAVLRNIADRCDRFARECCAQMDRKWEQGTRKIFVMNTPSLHFRGLASLGNDRLEKLCASATGDSTIVVHVLRQSDHWEASGKFSWARHCWEIGHALRRRVIPSLVPICLWEPRGISGPAESFAVQREPSWAALAARISSMRDAKLLAVGERVTDLLRRFHQQGFSHHRLGIDAFEVQFHGVKPAVRLVRLGDVHQQMTPPRQRLEELASLVSDVVSRQIVTRSTWLRWLRRYLGRCAAASWKADWRFIAGVLSATPQRRAA